ncbi:MULTISPECIES: hypothetical protein [Bradyrhizobium]|uniref:hypothetical protein n=1 Tax=Bradyrhizobium TaxID=374 RepID=UPI001374837A|nr:MULTISPECIES: hypothetical protein [Bradyrhizobium]WOH60394.1 hypothetical protein RX329_10005 [Bradyrhizobium sp. BWC-3-1]
MTVMLDWTFSNKEFHNGRKVKGTYFRRINDIDVALDKYGAHHLPPAAKFVAYYWACEKLCRAIIGIADEIPAAEQMPEDKLAKPIKSHFHVQSRLLKLNMPFDIEWLKLLFERQQNAVQPTSAKRIRDRLFHDFGPTQVDHVLQNEPTLLPIMLEFLNLRTQIIHHLESLQSVVADPPW